jgi:hypothetical protein
LLFFSLLPSISPVCRRLNRSLFVLICSGYFFALIILEVHDRARHGVDARLASIDLELNSALKTKAYSGALSGASDCLRALGFGLPSAWLDSDLLLGLAAGDRTQVEAYLCRAPV